MAPEMSHQMPTTPPNTPTKSSEPVATSTIHEEMGASISMLSERLDISTMMRPSQPPGGVAHPAYPAQGAPALSQGEQAMFSEAYSYLDQAKAQFVDQPDIYNTFVHFLMGFQSRAIDFPSIVSRISELFAGHPNLLQGFNIFLPSRYRIECGASNDPNTICATDRPVAKNALTPTQTAQGASMNGVAPQQPDAAQAKAAATKDAESFDLSMMVQCSTDLPVP